MLCVETIEGLGARLAAARESGATVGLVPTMGAFHEGHLTLMRRAREENDVLVVSIFVNPMQFDRKSDFRTYPRDEAADEKRAEDVGVDYLFVPAETEMYPDGFRTRVEVEELSDVLCGAVREGHFAGVATIVAKLFSIVRPDRAYFGEKDYQQLVIVRQMVEDLNMRIDVVGIPTVREADGLAMSSRNRLLGPSEREAATVLGRSLVMAQQMVEKGERDAKTLEATVRRMIGEEPLVRLEYLNVVSPETLRDIRTIKQTALIALAAHVGMTRLIDNALVNTGG